MGHNPLMPNAFSRRFLDPAFWGSLETYIDWVPTGSRNPGLLYSGRQSPLPYLSPADVLNLEAIDAIGELGYRLLAAYGDTAIPAMDTSSLPAGSHEVYACLCRSKEPCGRAIEARSADGVVRGFSDLRPQVILAAGDSRLEHLDWLKVAVVERERAGGGLKTFLDESFHPSVVDLRAYGRPNPLVRLADQALDALVGPDGNREQPIDSLLRVELGVLRGIAEVGDPKVAFASALRCIQLIRLSEDPVLILDGALESHRYSSEQFCGFMAQLERTLGQSADPLPEVIEADGAKFLRSDDQLEQDDEFWHLRPARDGFKANRLAVYLPKARPGSIPMISYSTRRFDDGNFAIARPADHLSGAGSAFLLEDLPVPIQSLYLTASSETLRQRLEQHIGDMHALYYE